MQNGRTEQKTKKTFLTWWKHFLFVWLLSTREDCVETFWQLNKVTCRKNTTRNAPNCQDSSQKFLLFWFPSWPVGLFNSCWKILEWKKTLHYHFLVCLFDANRWSSISTKFNFESNLLAKLFVLFLHQLASVFFSEKQLMLLDVRLSNFKGCHCFAKNSWIFKWRSCFVLEQNVVGNCWGSFGKYFVTNS